MVSRAWLRKHHNVMRESDVKLATSCGAGASSGLVEGIGFVRMWPELMKLGWKTPIMENLLAALDDFPNISKSMLDKLSKTLNCCQVSQDCALLASGLQIRRGFDEHPCI